MAENVVSQIPSFSFLFFTLAEKFGYFGYSEKKHTGSGTAENLAVLEQQILIHL